MIENVDIIFGVHKGSLDGIEMSPCVILFTISVSSYRSLALTTNEKVFHMKKINM